MTSWAYSRFTEWQSDGSTGPVVVYVDGDRMHPGTAQGHVRRYKKQNPILGDGTPFPDITIESCRHSFGTAAIDAGVEVAKVAKWMGHADIKTTYNNYIKPRMAALHESATSIDRAFAKTVE